MNTLGASPGLKHMPRSVPVPIAAASPAPGPGPRPPLPSIEVQARGIWRYLRMHGATAHEADDLVQEAFVVALQKGALALEPAAAFTFLRRTARFLFLRRRQGGLEATLLADAVDELWSRDCAADGGAGLLDALRRCLSRLTGRARRAVELSYGLGEHDPASRDDVAAALGLQPNGVKTLMQRARQQLRTCIEARPFQDRHED